MPVEDLRNIQLLSLTDNELQDADMLYISEIVKHIDTIKPHMPFDVDLSENEFHGYFVGKQICDTHLLEILSCDSVRHVNICHNRLASIDRRDFFNHTIPFPYLLKLIWIPQHFLSMPLEANPNKTRFSQSILNFLPNQKIELSVYCVVCVCQIQDSINNPSIWVTELARTELEVLPHNSDRGGISMHHW